MSIHQTKSFQLCLVFSALFHYHCTCPLYSLWKWSLRVIRSHNIHQTFGQKITIWLWRQWKRFCLSDSSSHHVTPGFMTFHYSLIQYSSCAFVLHFKIVRFIIGLVCDPKLFLELAGPVFAVWMLSERAIIRRGPAPPPLVIQATRGLERDSGWAATWQSNNTSFTSQEHLNALAITQEENLICLL